jgi:hypothetical protein
MSGQIYLPFADIYNSRLPFADQLAYDPEFKQAYQPIYLKGVKKIQSYENFKDLQAPYAMNSSFKKIQSTDNFIPEDLEYDLNPLFALKDANHPRITYSDVNKSKLAQNKKKQAVEADFRMKYKTEVCKYWAAYGVCEFGDQCAFAHGKQDLREKVHTSNNYKTKKCVQYHENLYCPYGSRCQFLHSSRMNKNGEKPPEEGPFSYVREMEAPELWFSHKPDCVCCMKRVRPRLPIFKTITELPDESVPENCSCECGGQAEGSYLVESSSN